MNKRWAQAPMSRHQHLLYVETLDEIVPPDHPIRTLDALMDSLDWTEWELSYDGPSGQPPIHPKLMASCILYGLLRGVRSSRELEDATRERVDFRWLLEGRVIDHSTFARFRTAREKALKQLNSQIAKKICERYESSLLSLVVDGTRVRANSDRHGARTEESLNRWIARITEKLNEHLAAMAHADASCANAEQDIAFLNGEIARLKAEMAKLEKARQRAQERDAHKQARDGKSATPVRVPVTDPDACIQPNKEGGYAPNYTPVVVVDQASGAIIFEDVSSGNDEGACMIPAIHQAQALGDACPERVLADGGVLSGETITEIEALGISVYSPTGTDFRESNPANRLDPTQPVEQCQWADLPRRNKVLGPSAFIYDSENNCYLCPMGQSLKPVRASQRALTGIKRVHYVCPGKAGCPLADECASKTATARTVVRDEYQDIRDALGRRMVTEEGCAIYSKRAHAVETVFARIKYHLRIRAFLLRGIGKVRTEWRWVCMAYNLKLLMRLAADGRGLIPSGPMAFRRALNASLNREIRHPRRQWGLWSTIPRQRRAGDMALPRAA